MSPLRLGPAITGPLAQIHDGGGVLARRYGRWLAGYQTTPEPPAQTTDNEGDGQDAVPAVEQPPEPEDEQSFASAARRVAGSAALAYLAAQIVQDSPGWMWPASIGGAIAAYRAGRPDDGPSDGEQQLAPDAEDVTEPDDADDDGPDDAEFIALVRDLIGPDGKGVHLAEIPPALTAEWPHRQWDAADARALAQRAGLPIHSTRSPNRPGPSTGIRRKDLPPPPLPEVAPVGVVGAGQPSDNDSDNSRVERIGEGGAVTRYAAETTARHHTIRRAS